MRDSQRGWYSLLNTAALVASSRLDLSDARAAPDFTVLSFYKLFRYPDLGALIIRKDTAGILQSRHYPGCATVDPAVAGGNQNSHARKPDFISAHFEGGILGFYLILGLNTAVFMHEIL